MLTSQRRVNEKERQEEMGRPRQISTAQGLGRHRVRVHVHLQLLLALGLNICEGRLLVVVVVEVVLDSRSVWV